MYSGEERRQSTRRTDELLTQLDHEVNGNGKPGLNQRMANVESALYGNKENGQKGMVEKQQEILNFVYSVRPFLNPKLLVVLFVLSIFACLKVLGTDLIVDIGKHFLGT